MLRRACTLTGTTQLHLVGIGLQNMRIQHCMSTFKFRRAHVPRIGTLLLARRAPPPGGSLFARLHMGAIGVSSYILRTFSPRLLTFRTVNAHNHGTANTQQVTKAGACPARHITRKKCRIRATWPRYTVAWCPAACSSMHQMAQAPQRTRTTPVKTRHSNIQHCERTQQTMRFSTPQMLSQFGRIFLTEQVSRCVSVFVCVCMCVHVCACVCMCVRTCICMPKNQS
jgi:hypothetical protein